MKNNPMLKFSLIILITLIISSIFWIGAIYIYYENSMTDKTKEYIQENRKKFLKNLNIIDFKNKNENYKNFINSLKNRIEENGVVYFELLSKDKNLIFKHIDKHLPKYIKSIINLNLTEVLNHHLIFEPKNQKSYLY